MRFGECGFRALKCDAHQQREFSHRDVLTPKQVDSIDGNDLRNSEGQNGFADRGEARAVIESQREIALDGGEARDGPILSLRASAIVRFIKWIEGPFREEHVLSELEFIGDPANKLARRSNTCAVRL